MVQFIWKKDTSVHIQKTTEMVEYKRYTKRRKLFVKISKHLRFSSVANEYNEVTMLFERFYVVG